MGQKRPDKWTSLDFKFGMILLFGVLTIAFSWINNPALMVVSAIGALMSVIAFGAHSYDAGRSDTEDSYFNDYTW